MIGIAESEVISAARDLERIADATRTCEIKHEQAKAALDDARNREGEARSRLAKACQAWQANPKTLAQGIAELGG